MRHFKSAFAGLRRLVLQSSTALLPAMAFGGGGWQLLDGPAIAQSLTARTVTYADGATQQFNADGTTLYTTDKPSTGRWRIDGAQYCSQWPPSDHWSCFDIARSADGLAIRFTAHDGRETTGRYIDLK